MKSFYHASEIKSKSNKTFLSQIELSQENCSYFINEPLGHGLAWRQSSCLWAQGNLANQRAGLMSVNQWGASTWRWLGWLPSLCIPRLGDTEISPGWPGSDLAGSSVEAGSSRRSDHSETIAFFVSHSCCVSGAPRVWCLLSDQTTPINELL